MLSRTTPCVTAGLILPVMLFACADAGRWRLRRDAPGDHYLVGRRDGPIRIDGRLDDPGWAHVPTTGAFRRADRPAGSPPGAEVRARWTWDREALYLAVTVRDGAGAIPARPPGQLDLEIRDAATSPGGLRLRLTPFGLERLAEPDREPSGSAIGPEAGRGIPWAWAGATLHGPSNEPQNRWVLELALPWRVTEGGIGRSPATGETRAVGLRYRPIAEIDTNARWWGETSGDEGSWRLARGWLEFVDGPLP